ncbi:hypothetical protein vBValMR10Z_314 [Vibrio phage vB_ValM_R10Z]|nr:hypothetical protein Va3_276 [Vibrio phage Va3]QNJ54854.1 hypothetical protein vBValMR10Z_314 [Vibrio phage vB_ValM_R10Z]URQ03446.1 hypothetical protein PVA23_69 [Vibrio phage PVA23]
MSNYQPEEIIKDASGNEYQIGAYYKVTETEPNWGFRESRIVQMVPNFDFAYHTVEEVHGVFGTIRKPPPKLIEGKAYMFCMCGSNERSVGIWGGTDVGFVCGPVQLKMSQIDAQTLSEV